MKHVFNFDDFLNESVGGRMIFYIDNKGVHDYKDSPLANYKDESEVLKWFNNQRNFAKGLKDIKDDSFSNFSLYFDFLPDRINSLLYQKVGKNRKCTSYITDGNNYYCFTW